MSKKVIWPSGSFAPARPRGQYASFNEFLAKSEKIRAEQESANNYLTKAMPAMLKLLEIRLESGEGLMVMRPLRYRTSVLESSLQDDLDKSFYNNQQPKPDRFVDVTKTINPGTKIVLKSLDPNLQEFVFQDGMGQEHSISYDDRNALLTQTDIFETIRNLFESEKLK